MDEAEGAAPIWRWEGDAMNHAKRERRSWMPYILTAGFVLLASGATLPHASASLAIVIREIRALFS